MKLKTTTLNPSALGAMETLWVYNALDSALTLEVRDAIRPQLDEVTRKTYEFSLSLQAPVLDMMRRGLRVDAERRLVLIVELEGKAGFLQGRLNEMAFALWARPLNPRSPKQVDDFFYNFMKLPEVRIRKSNGERGRTTNRDALEKLADYFQASIFISHILRIRELGKLAATLRSELSPDGRMRCSFNIAGTETGRFSSSSDAFDAGTNLQNQTEKLRRIYVADPGKKFASFDLKTGESFAVGIICKLLNLGSGYLEACAGGDLHTTACKLVWPSLGWTGNSKEDRRIAERPFYRHFSFRDMAKRGGHGTNYYGTPWTMAKHLKVERELIEEFQRQYFRAFPEIKAWHTWVAQELQTSAVLTTLMGRRRTFFGRVRDDTTLREAIAFEPQSCIADFTNQWLLRVHRDVSECELLLQVHDSLLVQFNDDPVVERTVIKKVQECARQITMGRGTDVITIPTDASTGWNWGKVDPRGKHHLDLNPDGLLDCGSSPDTRRRSPTPGVLDRRF